MSGGVERTLVVEARDLDTDERTVARFNVEMPGDEPGRRAQLSEVVGQLHPSARLRSFGGTAASFLDAEQLVVAHYREIQSEGTRDTSADQVQRAEQQPLFAA